MDKELLRSGLSAQEIRRRLSKRRTRPRKSESIPLKVNHLEANCDKDHATDGSHKGIDCKYECRTFSHTFILQLCDGYGFPFADKLSEFTVEFTKTQGGYFLRFPQFNFETLNELSPQNPYPNLKPPQLGGTLTTFSQTLPKILWPDIEQNFIVSNNDGSLLPYSFTNPDYPNIVFTGSAVEGSLIITNVSSTLNLRVGFPISSNDDPDPITPLISLGANITAIDQVNRVVAMDKPALATREIISLTSTRYPQPLSSYTITISTDGKLSIYGNSFVRMIPPGGHTILSTSAIYIPSSIHILRTKPPKNCILQEKFTDISQFPSPPWIDDGLRDSHINDAFSDVLAWCWVSNASQEDKSRLIMDTYVCVGNTNGVINKPINLTNFTDGNSSWDSSIAINRLNPQNLVATFSWGTNDGFSPMICISDNGGLDWSKPFYLAPDDNRFINTVTDYPGVIADKDGNFWICVNVYFIDYPAAAGYDVHFFKSTDQGRTWQHVYATPDGSAAFIVYDYPQFSMGVDELGSYGLWWIASTEPASALIFEGADNFDNVRRIGFIPSDPTILPSFLILDQYTNTGQTSIITSDPEGRVYVMAPALPPGTWTAEVASGPILLLVKEPGPLIQDLIRGPFTIFNSADLSMKFVDSYPAEGRSYFPVTARGVIYDDSRRSLYALINNSPQYQSQDYELFLLISIDQGRTWSPKIPVSNTVKKNRGFGSMALLKDGNDESKGLYFGWYDSRNSQSGTQVQYFGAKISSSALDCYVREWRHG